MAAPATPAMTGVVLEQPDTPGWKRRRGGVWIVDKSHPMGDTSTKLVHGTLSAAGVEAIRKRKGKMPDAVSRFRLFTHP